MITNNILIGPFIFEHYGITINSITNTCLYSFIACFMCGGIFPFILVWLKCDKRIFDEFNPNPCKLKNMNILKEYQQLQ